MFDRHPDLQVIVGHWGETVLFYLERVAMLEHMSLLLERPLVDYFRQNVWVTGSGLTSPRYLRWSAEVIGVDRSLYATDYPFVPTGGGRARVPRVRRANAGRKDLDRLRRVGSPRTWPDDLPAPLAHNPRHRRTGR